MTSNVVDPVTGGFSSPPAELPLGVSFADRVDVSEIDSRTAKRMYRAHHSYLPSFRKGYHYGIYFDGAIVGAVTFDAWPSSATIRGVSSDGIREVARVCIGLDMPNLASCGMSKAQDVFVEQRCGGIELLVTYIREDYIGSMFKALRGKGWEFDGVSEGFPPGNREVREIHEFDKERWVCELDEL